MYITYEIAQWSENHSKVVKDSNNKSIPQIVKQDEPFEIIPDGLPKPVYTPTKLVRISDMKVVDSSQVHEGYCALSYSWSWSGDYALDKVRNKYVRIDDGKHKIISIDKEAQHTEEEKEKEIPCTKVKYVQFKDVIQQICQQFNIKYLWFDQMCINQHHKEEKYREIKKMHTIYDNAHCTLVLVPEFRVDVMMNDHFFEKEQFYHLLPDYPYDIHDEDSPDKHYNAAALGLFKAQENIGRSDWYNRLWTLEEAIKSNILLFVGQNTHVFGHHLIPGHKIAYLTMPSDQVKLHQILFHAHQRTSSKEHDRVFALANIFPDIIQQIKIDYDQPIQDLMLQFYRFVAKKDITILHFEAPIQYTSTIQHYGFLPSWTGVHGMHYFYESGQVTFQNYDIIGNTMHVTSLGGITNDNTDEDDDSFTLQGIEDLPPIPEDCDNETKYYSLCMLVRPSGQENRRKVIDLALWSSGIQQEDALDRITKVSKHLQELSRFMGIKKEDLYWNAVVEDDDTPSFGLHFDGLTEKLDDPLAHYMILSDIRFPEKNEDDGANNKVYHSPVIKKKHGEEYYKAIGTVWTCSYNAPYIFSDWYVTEQTFLIQ